MTVFECSSSHHSNGNGAGGGGDGGIGYTQKIAGGTFSFNIII